MIRWIGCGLLVVLLAGGVVVRAENCALVGRPLLVPNPFGGAPVAAQLQKLQPGQPPGAELQPGANPRPIRPVITQVGPPKLDRHGDPIPAGAVARYGTVRLRHGADVQAMAFSFDAKLLCTVSATEDSVKLWDTTTGKEVARLGTTATLIGLTNTGSVVLVDDGKCKVWIPATNITRDLPEKTLPEGANPTALAVNPDGKSFAVATNGKVLVIDLQTGKTLGELNLPVVPNNNNGGGRAPGGRQPNPDNPAFLPTKLLYSPDGKWLAGSGQRTGVWLWEMRTGKRVRTYRTALDTPEYAFSPDVTKIAITGEQLHLYQLDAEEAVDGFKGPENVALFAPRFSTDGKTLYALEQDGTLLPFDAATGEEKDATDAPVMNLRPPLALAPGATMAAAIDQSGGIRIWDPKTGKGPDVSRLPGLSDAGFAADGKTVTALDLTNKLHTFDPATGAAGKVFDLDLLEDGLPTTWDGRSRRVAAIVSSGDDLEVHFIDADTKKLISKHSTPANGGLPLVSFAHANRDRAALFCQVAVLVVNPTTGKAVRTIATNEQDGQLRGAISPDGRVVAGAGGRAVTVWEVATGKKRFGFEVPNAMLVVFSPDARFLAACENGGTTTVLDMRTGALVRKIQNGDAGDDVTAVAFSPDGKRLATGLSTGHVTVWDVTTGDTIAPFAGHDGLVTSVAFASDGKRLVSTSNDGTALVWNVPEKPQQAGPVEVAVTGFDEAFKLLGATDGVQAQRGLDYLYRRPADAVKQIGDRVTVPTATPAATLAKYVADLESEDFATREAATTALDKIGGEAAPALHAAAVKSTSAEVRKVANELLGKLEAPAAKPDDLKVLRVVEVLERLDTAESRALLEKWAGGPAGHRATAEAAAALDRLRGK